MIDEPTDVSDPPPAIKAIITEPGMVAAPTMLFGFGEVLKSARQEARLSRAALAKKVHVTTAEIQKLERRSSVPALGVLKKLATAIGTSADALLESCGVQRPFPEAVFAPNGKLSPVLSTKLGKLYHSDCIRLMETLPDASVDCVFADPPFNLKKNYGPNVSDDIAERAYLEWSLRWMSGAMRILKPGGSFFLYNIPKWNLRLGNWLAQYLEFQHWVAVDMKFSLPIAKRLYPSHYSLLFFSKDGPPKVFNPPRLPIDTCRHCGGEQRDYGGYKDRMNPHGVNLTDVWTDLSPVRHKKYKRRSGANELPLKMLDRVLDIVTEEGDIVFDPFGGSGTTYVAAELKNRRWIGCEMGDCGPILDRFKHLAEERENLERLALKKNMLFTKAALALRHRHGHDTSKYRLPNGNGFHPRKLDELALDLT